MSDKLVRKVQKHFSISLIRDAVEAKWEAHEVAMLLDLMISSLGLEGTRVSLFLQSCDIFDPQIIAVLCDNGVNLSPYQVLNLIATGAKTNDHHIKLITDALEQGLLSALEQEHLDGLFRVTEVFSPIELRRLAACLCESAGSKKAAGRILQTFSEGMTTGEAASFVYDIMLLNFYADLRGKVKHMLNEFREEELREAVRGFMGTATDALGGERMTVDGEVVGSDVDDDGNLKDFVINDLDDDVAAAAYGDEDSDEEFSSDEIDDDETEDDEEDEEGEDGKFYEESRGRMSWGSSRDERDERCDGDGRDDGAGSVAGTHTQPHKRRRLIIDDDD